MRTLQLWSLVLGRPLADAAWSAAAPPLASTAIPSVNIHSVSMAWSGGHDRLERLFGQTPERLCDIGVLARRYFEKLHTKLLREISALGS